MKKGGFRCPFLLFETTMKSQNFKRNEFKN